MNIKKLTITELKALAFDMLAGIEQNRKNLQVINDELVIKSKGEPKKDEKKDAKKE